MHEKYNLYCFWFYSDSVSFRWVHVAPHPHHNPVNITYITNFLAPFFRLWLAHRHCAALHRPLTQPTKTLVKNTLINHRFTIYYFHANHVPCRQHQHPRTQSKPQLPVSRCRTQGSGPDRLGRQSRVGAAE